MTPLRYRRVRPIGTSWRSRDAGPLLARREKDGATRLWRYCWPRYRFGTLRPEEADGIQMPYPKAAPGALTLSAWTKPWPFLGRNWRFPWVLAGFLIVLVPGLVAIAPPHPIVWIGVMISAATLYRAGRHAEDRAARDDNVTIHARIWDRLLDLPPDPQTEPAYRRRDKIAGGLQAALHHARLRLKAPALLTLLSVGLWVGAHHMSELGPGMILGAVVLAGKSVWLAWHRKSVEQTHDRLASELTHRRNITMAHMAELRSLGVADIHIDDIASETDALLDCVQQRQRAGTLTLLLTQWGPGFVLAGLVAAWTTGATTAAAHDLLVSLLFCYPAFAAAEQWGRLVGKSIAYRSSLESIAPILSRPVAPDDDAELGTFDTIGLRKIAFQHPGSPWLFTAVTLDLHQGDVVALSGPSGSGKSTFLRVLMGLQPPSRGHLCVNGQVLPSQPDSHYRRQIGAVFQDQELGFSTIANAVLQDLPGKNEADAWLAIEAVGLADAVREMPMGMKTLLVAGAFPFGLTRQVLIARALLEEPCLLVLDEALSALDAEIVATIIAYARTRRMMVVYSTHRADLLDLADRVVHLGADGDA